ncbi:uncharacterized protein LOC116766999 [Danaus plexippus]|uniref:uncharacterized protein LOC116766999 n=1 Tax=Danaus plexippus TaxID=13037 RepID=UPI002AB209E4|nr:uncharacterized protein LOC116766999 [Danaus plexippus]
MESEFFDFDKSFKIMTFALKFNRSHPSIKRDLKWMFHFGLMHGTYFAVFVTLVYSSISIDLKNDDFTQATANGVLCLIFTVSTYKYCIIWYYQDLLLDVIKKINMDYEEAQCFTKEEKQIVHKFINKGREVNKYWFILIVTTAFIFLAKSLGLMLYYTIIDEFKLVHLYEMHYPKFLEDKKDTLSVFILLYIIFLFYDLYGALTYIGFEPFGPVLMLHSCGQLEIVRGRILKIFQSNYTDAEIIEQLNDIAKYLQKILSFIESIKTSFKILYELTLKATAITIPITIYQIIQSLKKGELRIEFLTVIVAGVGLSTTPCYYSEMLMNAGKDLNQAIYECGWEKNFEPKSRKLIFLLLLRTSKSMAVRTIFVEVCLEALTDVYHMAYAISNLLNAK